MRGEAARLPASSLVQKAVKVQEMANFSSFLRTLTPAALQASLYPAMTEWATAKAFAELKKGEPEAIAGPLIVSGFFDEASGIGRAGSLTLAALKASGFEPKPLHLRPLLAGRRGAFPVTPPGGAWLIHCNPDEAVRALAYVDSSEWRGRRRIGYWAWELPVAPPSWSRVAKLFHELWVPSRFVAEALKAGGVETCIRVMPHPVSLPLPTPKRDRARFKWNETDFVVLALGDSKSSATRKNLLGAIEIYKRSFPTSGQTCLVVKMLERDSQVARQIEAAADRPDISFIAHRLPVEGIAAMIASADVILSPHRSEGFGLVLAEAMLLGVPALATGWSGNMEFMSRVPELLIKSTLVTVNDSTGVYRAPDQFWAEPDVTDAVNKLRTLAASMELRAALAKRGREDVVRLGEAWTSDQLAKTALGGVFT